MKKTELWPDPIDRQYLWWRKKIDTSIGARREFEKIPVIVKSEWLAARGSKACRSLRVARPEKPNNIMIHDIQILELMTAEEQKQQEQLALERSLGTITKVWAPPREGINNRDAIVRAVAVKEELPISVVKRIALSIEQEITNSVVDGIPVILSGFATFSVTEKHPRRICSVSSGEIILTPGGVKTKIVPGRNLKTAVANSSKAKAFVEALKEVPIGA